MRHFQATVTREGQWWMVHIPEIDGLTQARRVADASREARECIAATLDLDIAEVTVDITREA